MNKERSAAITIGGMEYELVLTTRATKEIAGRYHVLKFVGQKSAVVLVVIIRHNTKLLVGRQLVLTS